METSEVRKRVRDTLERAKRAAAARRTIVDEAAREYDALLNSIAVPLFRQIANVLRADGHQFSVFTPAGGVRLTSDRSADDYVEVGFDTTGPRPQVLVRSRRGRGRRVVEMETPLGGGGPIRDISENDVLEFVLKEVELLISR